MNSQKLKRYTKASLLTCTWEKEGAQILSNDKTYLTVQEKEKIKFLLTQCIPIKKTRKKLWLIASGAKKEIQSNPEYYVNLLNYSKSFKSINEHQINMDLKRTFPEEYFFQKDENLEKLKNVLTCYSIRNASIGYCQGFNFIAGRLLQVLHDEEAVFWVFTQLIEEILPLNYYSELTGMITDCVILIRMLQKYLPDLYKFLIHEHSLEASVNNFIHKWFISLFTQNFSEELSLVIWDYLFLEGNIVMFKAGLAVFKILKTQIMSKWNFEDIYEILSKGTNEINDYSNLIFYLALRRFEFDYSFLALHRTNFGLPVIENIVKENETKLILKKKYAKNDNQSSKLRTVKSCDPRSPICINELENDFQHQVISFLILKTQLLPPKIIDNYFVASPFGIKQDSNQYNLNNNILIERRPHTCNKSESTLIEDDFNSSFCNQSQDPTEYFVMDQIPNKEMTVNFKWDYMKVLDNIKQDEKFDKANKMMVMTFTPKPFLDIEDI